jgi:Peptidase family M1 domain
MIRAMGWLVLWLLVLPATLAAGVSGAQSLDEILATKFDPQQCYRVRDLFLEREDVKFYLTDGHLIFAKPVQNRTIAALFLATSPMDQGELLVIPPTAGERLSVARFSSQPVLNEKFRTAMMFFTDDTAEQLRQSIEASHTAVLDAKEGESLGPRWDPVLKNLLENTAMRLLFDLISDLPRQSGFFGAVMGGSRLGRFDIVVDPNQPRQVTIGQSVWRDNHYYFETWCNFPSRSVREGRQQPKTLPGRLEDYHIDASVSPDLLLKVISKATFYPDSTAQRAFALELSQELYVRKVLLDGEPVEFLQLDQPVTSDVRRRQNNLILLVLPENPPAGAHYELEMQYDGRVISEADEGVYYVGSRGTWYPKTRSNFANFDLTFHYPAELDLVATAELLDTNVEGAVRTSRFRTPSPIRLAGFNLGRYKRASRQVGNYTVEVCANREVEANLRPPPPSPLIFPEPSAGRSRSFGRGAASTVFIPPTPELVRPSDRIEEVAASSAAAVQHLAEWFGAPATPHIVISPVPGNFGQGFPGLVYASTLSYFRPDDPPLKDLPAWQQRFYSELLRSHEISHQWWGNVVTIDDESDIWLMEALATYSAVMLVEEQRGPQERDNLLAEYRQRLLEVNQDGETVESAGPVVLGYRLRSSKFPDAPNVVMYEKGAWILHMLRGILGEDPFRAFLRELCDRYRYKVITTDDFRREAVRYLPANWPDPQLEVFFDQWVYSTGIPKYKLEYHTKGKAPHVQFQARLLQQGVPNHFTALVPLRIETLPGRSTTEYIRSDGRETELNLVLRNPPSNVTLDPAKTILAVIE